MNSAPLSTSHREFSLSKLPDTFFINPCDKALLQDNCTLWLDNSIGDLKDLQSLRIGILSNQTINSAQVVIGKIGRSMLRLNLSDNSKVVVGDNVSGHWFISVHAGAECTIGRNTTANLGVSMAVKILIEPYGCVAIGEDCMFSDGITLQCGDQHPLICIASGNRINKGLSRIEIEKHFWVARDVTVIASGKPVTLGSGGVAGSCSVISKSTPPLSVSVGNPARVVREGVSWSRHFKPTQEEISRLVNEFTCELPRE